MAKDRNKNQPMVHLKYDDKVRDTKLASLPTSMMHKKAPTSVFQFSKHHTNHYSSQSSASLNYPRQTSS